ncbi:hypothetical protein [Enterovibrio paralichthyis]|nr:hypothetical protein [Enterovibrio paralichthyis]MBV7296825.1 hypothetical protein [Enterovibrio paralichthyis]
MPVLFWPLLAGGVGFAGGLFAKDTVSSALKLLALVLVVLFLIDKSGVLK